MTKFDINRASVETLREFASDMLAGKYAPDSADKLRAECEVKLRTSAERNAEIVAKLRDYIAADRHDKVAADWYDLERLCAEPVTDDAPEQAGDHRVAIADALSAEPVNVLRSQLTEARAKIAELEGERDTLRDEALDLKHGAKTLEHETKLIRADRERLEAKVKELERNQVTPAMLAEFESGKQQRDTLRADNERFARQLLEARKPCERRHLTEAEEALCHYVDTRVVPWDTHTYGGLADYLNAVRNERRKQASDPDPKRWPQITGHVLSPEQHAGIGAGGGDEDNPEPKCCSCEELRNAGKLALAFLNDCSFQPEGEGHRAREALRKALS